MGRPRLGDAFDHQTDRLITISTELTPAVGVLGEHAADFRDAAAGQAVLDAVRRSAAERRWVDVEAV